MTTVIRGPSWSRKGLDQADSRYPLRVEGHLGRLVDGLLPGVITTTTHARSYALHTLVWAEAEQRGLDEPQANGLLRRCEVVLAGVTLRHSDHRTWIPAPHGGEVIRKGMDNAGRLDVSELAAVGAASYTPNAMGFGGVYLGSELRLGLLAAGRPPVPGPRADEGILRDALGEILDLAAEDFLSLEELSSSTHLCACGAPDHADGPWLRQLVVNPDPAEGLEETDRPRRDTARLLGRVLEGGVDTPTQDAFRNKVAFGEFVESDPVAASLPIAHAWRGAILRSYSVGAWRRLWSWVVELLGEPATVPFLAEQLAEALPDITVREMIDALPGRFQGGAPLPAEDELRRVEPRPDPFTEIQLLTLGAMRLDDLGGLALRAFAGREGDDDLGPRWFREQLDARSADNLRDFGRWLAWMMVNRAQRVALSKMVFRPNGTLWIPSRIRERAGLISRLSREGWADVGLRIDTFSSVLAGCGVIHNADGIWQLTPEGQRLLV